MLQCKSQYALWALLLILRVGVTQTYYLFIEIDVYLHYTTTDTLHKSFQNLEDQDENFHINNHA